MLWNGTSICEQHVKVTFSINLFLARCKSPPQFFPSVDRRIPVSYAHIHLKIMTEICDLAQMLIVSLGPQIGIRCRSHITFTWSKSKSKMIHERGLADDDIDMIRNSRHYTMYKCPLSFGWILLSFSKVWILKQVASVKCWVWINLILRAFPTRAILLSSLRVVWEERARD